MSDEFHRDRFAAISEINGDARVDTHHLLREKIVSRASIGLFRTCIALPKNGSHRYSPDRVYFDADRTQFQTDRIEIPSSIHKDGILRQPSLIDFQGTQLSPWH